MSIKIKKLDPKSISETIPLVWQVFCDYEAQNYSAQGRQAFFSAVNDPEYLAQLDGYGAFDGDSLIGIIATRDNGSHIALFFVDGKYHGQGFGKSLWTALLADNFSDKITVNSSLYAVEIYRKLGFVQVGDEHEQDGIRYVPMEYVSVVNSACPCPKTKCKRHGRCNECRAHHKDSNKLRPCEREIKDMLKE